MATFKSDQYTNSESADQTKSNEWVGRVRIAYFTYTTDGTESANDIVKLVKLPDKARVLFGQLHVDGIDSTGDGATTPSTIEIGDSDDQDRYLASTSVDSDTNTMINDASEAGHGHETSSVTDVELVFTAIDAESGKDIEGYLLYVTD